MRHPAGETITITRSGAATGADDAQGNPILGPDVTLTVSDVALEPLAAEEAVDSGLWTVLGYRLFCPYGTEFREDDRLTIRGVDGWQVVGDTAATGWRSPFDGRGRGVVVSARRSS